MFSRYINKYLRYSYCRAVVNYRSCTSASSNTDPIERDPAPYFFNEEVQTYLKTLTKVDYKKVFRTRKDGHKLEPPQFKFLTEEELQKAQEEAERKAEMYLQMPPVVKQRLEPSTTLCEDPALEGHDTSKFVFTDITFGLNDRKRYVVIREPNGTLRHATWEERDRIVPIYFPKPGRDIVKPRMFEGEYLESLLSRNKYEFILDRACVQFEPDNPDYHRITQQVYEHINVEKHFDILRSTRHFGPMVFHLVWTRNVDNLLCDIIKNGQIKDAILLIRLYHKIHPTAKSAVEKCDSSDDIEFIIHFSRLDSSQKSIIEKLLRSYQELQQEQKIVDEGIKKSHGILSETNIV